MCYHWKIRHAKDIMKCQEEGFTRKKGITRSQNLTFSKVKQENLSSSAQKSLALGTLHGLFFNSSRDLHGYPSNSHAILGMVEGHHPGPLFTLKEEYSPPKAAKESLLEPP